MASVGRRQTGSWKALRDKLFHYCLDNNKNIEYHPLFLFEEAEIKKQ